MVELTYTDYKLVVAISSMRQRQNGLPIQATTMKVVVPSDNPIESHRGYYWAVSTGGQACIVSMAASHKVANDVVVEGVVHRLTKWTPLYHRVASAILGVWTVNLRTERQLIKCKEDYKYD